MRLATLNLRHGGGRRMDALRAGLLRLKADLLVLTEFRDNEVGRVLRQELERAGLGHQAIGRSAPRVNTVFVASRAPFLLEPHRRLRFDPARLLRVRFPAFSLVAAHLPNQKAKLPHWRALQFIARETGAAPAIFAGDFNTGKNPEDSEGFRYTFAEQMEALERLGWVDGWRRLHPKGREFSWYSHRGRGFRLDHVFLSPALAPRLTAARFAHRVREKGATDHSALTVDVDV